ncbi:MlaD family protein [Methylocystis echinoides]|jgi:phospholipid/cholesterol/gamma-HCH transport system substrate-binding protein|uniref:MlaD family protein n=1 Tax=Methylocystis echinoides TaxID=29468 RepID=UPI00343F4F8B
METRANYALIGAFTLAVIFAAFGFVYWFSGSGQSGKQDIYQIVFTGSVSGLSRGSSVLFNGVKVGEVTHLAISATDPSKVDVLVKINELTPVKTDTRARLETRGFTGVADVLLVGGTEKAAALVAQKGQRYPQIQAERSEIQNLLGNVNELSTKAAEVLVKLDRLLDDNKDSIRGTLKNAEAFTKTLADNSAQISSFIKDASETAHALKPVAARLDKFLAAGEQTIKAIDPKQLKTITGNIAGASANLKHFSASGLRQYEQLAVDARKAVDTLDQAIKSIERDPSQFIWGPSQPATPSGGR